MCIEIFGFLLFVSLLLTLFFGIVSLFDRDKEPFIIFMVSLGFLIPNWIIVSLFDNNCDKVVIEELYSTVEISEDHTITDVLLYDTVFPASQLDKSKVLEKTRINLNSKFHQDFEPGTKFSRHYYKWGWLFTVEEIKEVK